MNTPDTIRPVHVIGRALACATDRPARHLSAWSEGEAIIRPRRAVPGYPSVERPYALLHGGEAPAAALDRVLNEALEEAALNAADRRQAAVIMGTSSLDIGRDEAEYARSVENGDDSLPLKDARWGRMLAQATARHDLHGPHYTVNTACSSSANALLYAQRMLSLDLAPAVIVIGYDSYTGISFSGFHGMLLLASEAYRPFDVRRDGIVLGEGVAAAVLVRADDRAEARIDGGHSAIDVTGITSASEDSLSSVMDKALKACGVDSIDAIKAHGTGTSGNDSAESAAIKQVFGERSPPFFSIKGGIGHTLGACGLVELLAMMDCRRSGFLPASIGHEQVDKDLPAQPSNVLTAFDGGRLLLNYFGFGGNNCSLVVSL